MPLPGLVEKTRFRIRSRERGRDKLRYCALRLLTPTYKDCSPELPASLSFLYYAIPTAAVAPRRPETPGGQACGMMPRA